ncbi:MAG: hypothetical protein LW839_00050 [Cryomorphaceae bacterium]|nr:hypothetical protein [Cryomorphaceae bacterium]
MKSLAIVFLIALQLASQVGIPIHKHFCEMDGVFASVFVKVDHECKEPHPDLPPCCQTTPAQEKDDCCSDELEVVKTDIDQLASAQQQFTFESLEVPVFLNPRFEWVLSHLVANTQTSKFPKHRPPPLWLTGRQIKTLHQTWQI